ncbi:ParA family protein [Deinococcus seoulensis]|uniref:ParA family protein n=1 Tax=Deinococcus seoulensis TaxID=1837379 RepID=UPI00166E13DC|nr:ParA family protein [Deinococcus seoulensis]
MKVISVTGLKGGSGKTSTAVPLAWEAAKAGRTVLLDLDPTPSASQWMHAANLTGETLRVEQLDIKGLDDRVNDLEEAGDAEWVIIDTPPVARDVVMQAAGVADLVVIPMHIGSGDVAQVVQTLGLLKLPRQANPNLQVIGVLNHAGTMAAQTRRTREAVEGVGLAVAQTVIPYREVYVNAKGSRPTAKWWHFTQLWTEIRGLV